MLAAGAGGVAIGTGIAAVVSAILLDGVIDTDNADAVSAGTFLLSYFNH